MHFLLCHSVYEIVPNALIYLLFFEHKLCVSMVPIVRIAKAKTETRLSIGYIVAHQLLRAIAIIFYVAKLQAPFFHSFPFFSFLLD